MTKHVTALPIMQNSVDVNIYWDMHFMTKWYILSMTCFSYRYDFSFSASSLLHGKITWTITTIYLVQIIGSLFTYMHPFPRNEVLDKFHHCPIVCQVFIFPNCMLCILCRTPMDSLVPSLYFEDFSTTFHSGRPLWLTDCTWLFNFIFCME